MKRITIKGLLVLILFAATAACAPIPSPSPTTAPPDEVTVVMSYIPDIQFAPFFIAEQKGYFAEEGIKVNYNWGFEFDGIKLVGANQADFAIVGGDQILQARAQDIPIVYVGNWYNAFPISVVSFADKNIKTPQDLIGKKVGLPGLFGASYTAWRALLYTQKINEADITVENIGFTQIQALDRGVVDAAVVYANNEPVQLRLQGKEINEIKTWEYAQLVGNGVATNAETIKKRPELVRGFVRALLRGVQDTIDNPSQALEITVKQYPEFGGERTALSKAVLDASIALWKNDKPGETRLADWQAMEQFMREAGFIPAELDVTQAFTNEFIQ